MPCRPRSLAHCSWALQWEVEREREDGLSLGYFFLHVDCGFMFVYIRHRPSFGRGEAVGLVSKTPVPKIRINMGKVCVSEMDIHGLLGRSTPVDVSRLFPTDRLDLGSVSLLLKPPGLRATDERVCQRAHQPRQAGEIQDYKIKVLTRSDRG